MDRENQPAVTNSHFRQTLLAINQVLGEKGSKDIYRSAGLDEYLATLPPDDLTRTFNSHEYSRLLQTIETAYDQKGPWILQRIGRETFHIVLREQSTLMSSAKRIIGLWAPEQRIQIMMQTIVDTQQKTYPQTETWLEDKHGQLAYIEQNCLVCAGRQSSQPVCHLTVGFIQEALQWAIGKEVQVNETDCVAKGDAYCRFSIGDEVPYRNST
jgi:predicted hydrocarbon binding protein